MCVCESRDLYAIKFSIASKLGKMALRPGEGKYNLRSVGNKIKLVDSFFSLIIGCGVGKNNTKFLKVAVIKNSPIFFNFVSRLNS